MSRTMTYIKRAGLILFGFALTLICLELGLRAAGWFFLNNRAASVHPAPNDSNHYTILCLGESTTADLAVWGAESYPAQLERILNERAEGIEFRVINGGVPATTTDKIVEKLPRDLEHLDPDIVVAMMGVNDGGLIDTTLQVGGNIRIWKLAKTLYHASFGTEERAPSDKRGKSTSLLRFRRLYLLTSSKMIFEGDYEGAEAQLLPMLQNELPEFRNSRIRAYGALAILNWQRGREREADQYHQEFLELRSRFRSPTTKESYDEMRRILSGRAIPLIAVQYPGIAVESLQRLIGADANVAFVDNEDSFVEAVKNRPAGEIYRDLFAGIFGHLTPDGNRILAENVADVILSGTVYDRLHHK